MIEGRQRFLKRFLRMGSAGLVVLMLVGVAGCGGVVDQEEQEEEEEQQQQREEEEED